MNIDSDKKEIRVSLHMLVHMDGEEFKVSPPDGGGWQLEAMTPTDEGFAFVWSRPQDDASSPDAS